MSVNLLHQFKNEIKDKVIFIVGGGVSVNDIDPDDLKDEKVIALNSGFVNFPNAIAVFWVDGSWSAQHEHKLKAHSSKYRFNSRISVGNPHILGPGNSFILEQDSQAGFTDVLEKVSGNNSGTQCINLCINCEPSTIVLLGFDLGGVNGVTHFHKEYERPTHANIFTDMFLPNFKALYDEIKFRDNIPPIINASPISKLRHFPKDDYRNYLST